MASPNKKRPETWAKRFALNLKTTEDIRQKVEERAKKSGRSITLEVEQQLIKSFEIEEKEALNEEIKAEMRGTIAALERRIALAEQTEHLLWPDESARILGQGFAMVLTAARHVSGEDWREDRSASLVVGGAVRRLMDRCSRGGGSIMAELFDGARIATAADSIAETVGSYLGKAMPPLPDRLFQVTNWTGRCFYVNEFRDVATGEILETITGSEWDAADPEQRGDFGEGYMAAIARFKPIRERVDAETFIAHVLKDGTHKRISFDFTPAGPGPHSKALAARPAAPADGTFSIEDDPMRPASLRDGSDSAGMGTEDAGDPDDEPRLVGMEETSRLAADLPIQDGGRPRDVFETSDFAKITAELPLVESERAAAAKRRQKQTPDVAAAPADAVASPRRRTKAKT